MHTVLYRPTFGFPLNLLPLDFHRQEILLYHSYYARKSTKLPIWNKMKFLFPDSWREQKLDKYYLISAIWLAIQHLSAKNSRRSKFTFRNFMIPEMYFLSIIMKLYSAANYEMYRVCNFLCVPCMRVMRCHSWTFWFLTTSSK